MKLKKGGRVEVLHADGKLPASWFPAEIVAGNGHYYSVRYDQGAASDRGALPARVPRKLIRPTPPLANFSTSWAPGDAAELFGRGMWKPVLVSKVRGDGYLLVHLPGCSETFEVHCADLRVRHSWQDDQWTVVGKKGDDSYRNFKRLGPNLCKPPKGDPNNSLSYKLKLNATSCGVKRVSAIDNLPHQTQRIATKRQKQVEEDVLQWGLAEEFSTLPEKGQ